MMRYGFGGVMEMEFSYFFSSHYLIGSRFIYCVKIDLFGDWVILIRFGLNSNKQITVFPDCKDDLNEILLHMSRVTIFED